MAYSSSDFQGDVINHLLELELLPHELADDEDAERSAKLVKDVISDLLIDSRRVGDALKFHDELLESVETLTGIAEQHGVIALANVNYLQSAILRDTNIELASTDKGQLDMLRGLPSGEQWLKHVTIVD
ncbi:hypothetical protein AWB81_01783 [Caballeronia arationis]|nr:hypothetical protein AWB81_01783 [Caballeronia arationis]